MHNQREARFGVSCRTALFPTKRATAPKFKNLAACDIPEARKARLGKLG